MGLDMFLYKASKPTDLKKDKVYTEWDYDGELSDCVLIDKDQLGRRKYKDLAPIVYKIKFRQGIILTGKLAEEHGYVWGDMVFQSYYELGFKLYNKNKDDTDSKRVTLTIDEVKKKYYEERVCEKFAVRCEELMYWRKEYDLQDFFYDTLKYVENCGYHKVEQDILEAIAESPHVFQFELDCSDIKDDKIIVYHEWY